MICWPSVTKKRRTNFSLWSHLSPKQTTLAINKSKVYQNLPIFFSFRFFYQSKGLCHYYNQKLKYCWALLLQSVHQSQSEQSNGNVDLAPLLSSSHVTLCHPLSAVVVISTVRNSELFWINCILFNYYSDLFSCRPIPAL